MQNNTNQKMQNSTAPTSDERQPHRVISSISLLFGAVRSSDERCDRRSRSRRSSIAQQCASDERARRSRRSNDNCTARSRRSRRSSARCDRRTSSAIWALSSLSLSLIWALSSLSLSLSLFPEVI